MALNIRSATSQHGVHPLPSLEGSLGQAAISGAADTRIQLVAAAVRSCQGGDGKNKLSDREIEEMIRYCDEHKSGSAVVRRKESKLARTVLTGGEGHILMTLHSHEGDRVIGDGSAKKAKLAVNATTGEVRVVTICSEKECISNNVPTAWTKVKDEIRCMFELVGAEGVVQIIAAHVTDNASSSEEARAIMLGALNQNAEVVETIRDYVSDGTTPSNKAYIVMEYCKRGNLLDAVIAEPCFLKPDDRVRIMHDSAKGLRSVIERGWIHQDVKLENVFLCEDERGSIFAKLGDFGFACPISDVSKQKKTLGGFRWASPEKAKTWLTPDLGCASAITEASDVWALGLLFAAILRRHPWFLSCQGDVSDNVIEILTSMARANQDQIHREIDTLKIDPKITPLIKKMLSVEPSARPTMADVLREVEAYCEGRIGS